MTYITPISPLQSENLSGILQLRIARVQDIVYFPRIIGGEIQGNITFKPNAGFIPWHTIYATPIASGEHTDSVEGIRSGRDVKFTLPSANVPEDLLRRMQSERLILLYTDANLRTVVIGTHDIPLRFSYSASTGRLGTGRSEYPCILYGTGPVSSATYFGDIVDYTPSLVIQESDGTVIAVLTQGQTYTLNSDFYFSERLDPLLASTGNEVAYIIYTRSGITTTAAIQLGRTLIVTSDYTLEFE